MFRGSYFGSGVGIFSCVGGVVFFLSFSAFLMFVFSDVQMFRCSDFGGGVGVFSFFECGVFFVLSFSVFFRWCRDFVAIKNYRTYWYDKKLRPAQASLTPIDK